MRRLPRNDLAQYDELADQWWEASGGFAALHWLAASRAEHIPPAPGPDAVLVDLACGGGLMAPHVARLGYRHVGVDLGVQGLRLAREHGVLAVRGAVLALLPRRAGLAAGPAGRGAHEAGPLHRGPLRRLRAAPVTGPTGRRAAPAAPRVGVMSACELRR